MRTMKTPSARPTALESQKGFTLIELSIVLVIIGLLVGGVIKGKDLIDNAKVNKAMQEFEALSSGLAAYRERYGVDARTDASGRFGTEPTATAPANVAWWRLRNAGLVSLAPGATGPTAAAPVGAFGGDFTLVAADVAFAVGTTNQTALCIGSVPAKAAAAVDAKFDNGIANTGTTRANNTNATATASNMTADFGTADNLICVLAN